MKKLLSATAAVTLLLGASFASAAEWKDGVLWNEANVGGDLNGFTAVQIEFGFEPGKCSGPLTTVGEWLRMKEGKFTFKRPGEKPIERGAGDDPWHHAAGTAVEVCNEGTENAVLVGVQFRPVNPDQSPSQ